MVLPFILLGIPIILGAIFIILGVVLIILGVCAFVYLFRHAETSDLRRFNVMLKLFRFRRDIPCGIVYYGSVFITAIGISTIGLSISYIYGFIRTIAGF